MKIKKLAAVLSAAALTVTSLSVAAFATGTTIKATGVTVNAYPDAYADKTASAEKLGAAAATVGGDGTTITVNFSEKTETEIRNITADSAGRKDILYLKITTDSAANFDTSTFAFTSGYGWDDTNHKEFNVNEKNIMLWLQPFGEEDTVIKYKTASDADEQTLTVKFTYKAAAPVDPDPVEPEATFGTKFNGSKDVDYGENAISIPKAEIPTLQANNAIVITFEKKTDDTALKVVGGDWDNAFYNTAVTKSPLVIKLTGEQAALLADNGLTIQGKNVTVKKVEILETAPADDTEDPENPENPENPGGEAPSNPGYVVITPNDTTAADTTAAAPEVVTGANGESVEAPKDVVPEGAVLEAKEQTKEEAVKAVEAVKTTDDNKEVVETVKKSVEDGKAAVMDINLVKDGAKVQPNGTIKVTINIPEILKNAAALFVYRVEDNGTFTDVKATVSGGKLVFSTGHFSTYIITSEALTGNAVVTEAAATTEPAATTAGGSTSTDDKNQATGVVLAVIPAVLAAAGVVASKKRK